MGRGGGRSGGGGGGGSRGGPQPPEVLLSKKLSWLLRHGAEKEGLQLGRGGYVNLNEVLTNRTIRSLSPRPTLDTIRDIVRTNAKQRFSLIHISAAPVAASSHTDLTTTPAPPPDAAAAATSSTADTTPPSNPDVDTETDTDPTHYLIRANQGHSLAVSEADLLTPLTLSDPIALPRVVVHGTRHEHWNAILASGGLSRMTRLHVHFATGVPEAVRALFGLDASSSADDTTAALNAKDNAITTTATNATDPAPQGQQNTATTPPHAIISGMRSSSTLLIFIDLQKALRAGLRFWVSANGVVLGGGEGDGVVGVQFFKEVRERGGRVLVRDGVVVGEPEWRGKR